MKRQDLSILVNGARERALLTQQTARERVKEIRGEEKGGVTIGAERRRRLRGVG